MAGTTNRRPFALRLASLPWLATLGLIAACSLSPPPAPERVVKASGDGAVTWGATLTPPPVGTVAAPVTRAVELGLVAPGDLAPDQFKIVDERDRPLAGAVAIIGTERLETDERGVFTLPAAARGQSEIVAEIAARGYVGRMALLIPGHALRLQPIEDNRTFISARGGGVARNSDGKLEVLFPPGALDRDATVTVTREYTEHAYAEALHPGFRDMDPVLKQRPSLGNYKFHIETGGAGIFDGRGAKARFKLEPRLVNAVRAGIIDMKDELKRDADGTLWFEMPVGGTIAPPRGAYGLLSHPCEDIVRYEDNCHYTRRDGCKDYRVLHTPAPSPRGPRFQLLQADFSGDELREMNIGEFNRYKRFAAARANEVPIDAIPGGACYEYVKGDEVLGSMLHADDKGSLILGDKGPPVNGTYQAKYAAKVGLCLYRPHNCGREACIDGDVRAVYVNRTSGKLVYIVGKGCEAACPPEDQAACEPCASDDDESPCKECEIPPCNTSTIQLAGGGTATCPPGYVCSPGPACPNPPCTPSPDEEPPPNEDGGVRSDIEDPPSPGPCGRGGKCDEEHNNPIAHISSHVPALVKWWSDDPRLKDKPVAGALVSFSHKAAKFVDAVLSATTDAVGHGVGIGAKGALGFASVSHPQKPWTYGTTASYNVGCNFVPLFLVHNRPVCRLIMEVGGKPAPGPFTFESTLGPQKVPAVPVATIPVDGCKLDAATSDLQIKGSWKHDPTCAIDAESAALPVTWNRTEHVLNPVKVWFSREITTDLRYQSDDNRGPSDQLPPPAFQWAGKVPKGAAVTFSHKVSGAALKLPANRDQLSFTGVDGQCKTWGLSFDTGRVRAVVTGPDGTSVDGAANYTIQNNRVTTFVNAGLPLMQLKVTGELGLGKFQMRYTLRRSDGQGGQERVMELEQPEGGQWVISLPVEDPVNQPYSWTFEILDIWGKGEWKDIRVLAPDLAFEFEPQKVQRGKVYEFPGTLVGLLTTSKYRVNQVR